MSSNYTFSTNPVTTVTQYFYCICAIPLCRFDVDVESRGHGRPHCEQAKENVGG